MTVDINPVVRIGLSAVKQYPVIPGGLSVSMMNADGSGQSRLTDKPAADFARSRSGAGNRKPHRVRPYRFLRAEEIAVGAHGICLARQLGIVRDAGLQS